MAKGFAKLVYKPDSQSTDEFIMIIDDVSAYEKFKEGDSSIPLALIVDSFDVFHSGTGAQGTLGKVSKQQLETIFDTSNEAEVAKLMVQRGTLQTSTDSLKTGKYQDRNDSKGWSSGRQ